MPTTVEIFKLLPKTNCGDCGYPTCLAFAMQLANAKVELQLCPPASEEAKAVLAESSVPPIRLVSVGAGNGKFEAGQETELFRHEKKFYRPTGFALVIDDTLDNSELMRRIKEAGELRFERVGVELGMDMFCIRCKSNEAARFKDGVVLALKESPLPITLMCEEPSVMEGALEASSSGRPLIHCANQDNWREMADLALRYACPLVVGDDDLNVLSGLTEKISDMGVKDMMLDFGKGKTPGKWLTDLTVVRRLAIKNKFKPLGYPVFMDLSGESEARTSMLAPLGVMKYGSIIALKDAHRWMMYPLFVLRQNIFTDPQMPIQVEPGLYGIGNPDENSPLLFTTNFSLTYFIVKGDIEKSKVPCHLLVVDTEGMSVLTAFSAGKLNAEHVGDAIETFGVSEKISHNTLVIPGMLARMAMKLKEELAMEIVVGPRESSGIPAFLKNIDR